MKSTIDNFSNSNDITGTVIFLWTKKWVIILVAILTGASSFIITKLFHPQYESFCVVFPASNFSRDKTLENFDYGFDVHAERLIQIMQSGIIMDSIVNEFDLARHYRLDTTDPKMPDKLMKIYYERVTFVKTRYKAVTVIVQDEVPEIAASIANEVARLVNVVNNELIQNSVKSAIQSLEGDVKTKNDGIVILRDSVISRISFEKNRRLEVLSSQITEVKANVSALMDSMDSMRKKLNVFDFGFQINILNGKLAEAQSLYQDAKGSVPFLEKSLPSNDTLLIKKIAQREGSKKQIDFFLEELAILNSKNREFNSLSDQLSLKNKVLENLSQEFSKLSNQLEPQFETFEMIEPRKLLEHEMGSFLNMKTKLEFAKSSLQSPLPAAHIVSPARASSQKVFPRTIPIVLISSLASAFFVIMFLLFRENMVLSISSDEK